MDHYHTFSTDNLVDWRDEGEILNAGQVPWGRKEGGFMWAPDAAYRNGKYYFYFPHPSGTTWNDTWKIGVATSSHPTSDFKVVGYLDGVGGFSMIDPAVFIDTDGQAYLYYGGGGHCAAAKLSLDMTHISGPAQPMAGLNDFHEATWVFKRKDIYYLTYADNHPNNNEMEYATSASPLGPWTSRGVYLTATDCDTTHGSVVEYKGQWYQFYHNKSISGQGNLRSICVDKLSFNDDGSIQTVVQTKTGPPPVGDAALPDPNTVHYRVEDAEVGQGADVETNDATQVEAICNLHVENSYARWSKVRGGDLGGRATIDISYATRDNSKLHLDVNGVDYSFINTISTGDWDKFSGHACLTIFLNPGDANVITFTGGHGGANVNGMSVTPLP